MILHFNGGRLDRGGFSYESELGGQFNGIWGGLGGNTYAVGYYAAILKLTPCEGNFDEDNDADSLDTMIFSNNYGKKNCTAECTGDFNSDGDIDGSDFDQLIINLK